MLQTMPTAWRASVSMEDELTRLRKGDLEALAGLIEQYQARLYRYLLRLVHEPATAEDLFQQTWIHVAEKIRSYDPKRSFDNWAVYRGPQPSFRPYAALPAGEP